jgi:hypothetical protein
MDDWPYGSGTGEQTRYLEYSSVLHQNNWLKIGKGYFSPTYRYPTADRDVKGEARRYWVPLPSAVTLRDIPIAPWELGAILTELHLQGCEYAQVYGEPVRLDEAYHAMYLVDQRLDRGDRYKRDVRRGIQRLVRAIRTRAAERQDSGDSLWQQAA